MLFCCPDTSGVSRAPTHCTASVPSFPHDLTPKYILKFQTAPRASHIAKPFKISKCGLVADYSTPASPLHVSQRGNGYKRAKASTKPIYGDESQFDPMPFVNVFNKKAIVLFGADHYAQRLPQGRFICWDKSVGQGAAAVYSDAEFAWTNRRNARNIFRHFWMGATRAGSGASSKEKRKHPSQKPVELMQWCIEHARIGVGKIVLDPYMGVGSTGLACIRSGRKFVGAEIDKEYFDIACERIQREYDAMRE